MIKMYEWRFISSFIFFWGLGGGGGGLNGAVYFQRRLMVNKFRHLTFNGLLGMAIGGW